MTLLGYQSALARLLTDTTFRHAFIAGDPEARVAFELDRRELESLLATRADRLELHSHLLAHGRIELGLRGFPLTSSVAAGHLDDALVEEFCARHPPRPQARGALLVEADRVFEFLLARFDDGRTGAAWMADLLRYEYAHLELSASVEAAESAVTAAEHAAAPLPLDVRLAVPVIGTHVRLVVLRFPILELVADLEQGSIPGVVEPLARPQHVLFHKVAGEINVAMLRLSEPLATLVRACDGRRTITGVIASVRKAYGTGVESGALAAIDELRARAVVDLVVGV